MKCRGKGREHIWSKEGVKQRKGEDIREGKKKIKITGEKEELKTKNMMKKEG